MLGHVSCTFSFGQAYRRLRRGGTLVFVALPADNAFQLPIFETVLNGTRIVGSIVGTRVDLVETFELHAAGKTAAATLMLPLDDVLVHVYSSGNHVIGLGTVPVSVRAGSVPDCSTPEVLTVALVCHVPVRQSE